MPSRREAILGLLAKGDATGAEELCDEYIRDGGGGDALYLAGIVRVRLGDMAGARRLVARAAELQPQRADIAYNFGVMLKDSGDLRGAAAQWRRATMIEPNRQDALGNLALAMDELGDPDAAQACWQRLLRAAPTHRDALYNYANFLQRQNEPAAALAIYERLAELHPDFAPGWINLGMLHKRQGRPAQAEAAYRQAIAVNADNALAHFNLSNLLLMQERWTEGFSEYEWRARLPGSLENPWGVPAWTGREPAGSTILVWGDQGFGDSLQFLRYVPRIAAMGHKPVLLLREPLHRIAATVAGVHAVQSPASAIPKADAHVALSSLPHRLEVAEVGRDWTGPYISVPADVPAPSTTEGAIGLVWGGDPAMPYDADRSMTLGTLAPLFDLPARFVSLQVGPRIAELGSSPWAGRLPDLGSTFTDFAATSAAMAKLALVVTTDTASAHLAGALGKPTFVLLPAYEADWRWGATGPSTPWYPTLRLFRQSTPRDWSGPVAEVAAAISTYLGSRS